MDTNKLVLTKSEIIFKYRKKTQYTICEYAIYLRIITFFLFLNFKKGVTISPHVFFLFFNTY